MEKLKFLENQVDFLSKDTLKKESEISDLKSEILRGKSF
jgi:hypothetical protein